MIWHLVRYWITFLIPVFYKRISITNKERLAVNGPVLVAMNHPNAFTDPIIIAYLCYPTRLKYMARGDAFKPGLITYFLEQLGIVPIFRIQDAGKEGLKKNEESYQRVYAFLKKDAKLIVFAEGLCVQERRLRPLKKGFARLAFGAYEHTGNENLTVLPIGVNYSQPNQFRSDVLYRVGEPMPVKAYVAAYEQNPAKTTNQFLKDLEGNLKSLITHINDKQNDTAVLWMESLIKEEWLLRAGLSMKDLEDDFTITQKITETVNRNAASQPELWQEFKTQAAQYFSILKANAFDDYSLNPLRRKQATWFGFACQAVILFVFSPIYLMALLGNFLPLYLTDVLAKKANKQVEFYSSFAFAFGMVLFLVNYLIVYALAHLSTGNAFYSLSLCVLFILSAVAALRYHPYLQKTLLLYRLLRSPQKFTEASKQREKLITLINKMV
jgi:1-acyl-sn-glycerol-3-phosphate acyltransferase